MKAIDRMESHRVSPYTAARAMGWFSIALGACELAFARPLARKLRMRGSENLIRGFGVREIATGIGILGSKDPRPWMLARVAGDALDLATLAARLQGKIGRNAPVALALGAVAGATAVDLMTVRALSERDEARTPREYRDYSARSGFPDGIAKARGAAKSFKPPADLVTPAPLRPWTH